MKKYAPYIFILIIILVGLFSPIRKVNAESPYDACIRINGVGNATSLCLGQSKVDTPAGTTCTAPNTPAGCTPAANKTALQKYVEDHGCGFGMTDHSSLWPGCFVSASYGLFYVIPSWLLYVSAYFFNVLISITLSSKLFAGSTFIPAAWGVVRDLSNIFFILILLFIAIEVILGLGGINVKKTIAKVVIIALLINFSMFFTQVIIDTSNILALIFYNKISVATVDKSGNIVDRPYDSAAGEKDVAGGMVSAFDPTTLISADFFAQAVKHPPVNGKAVDDDKEVSFGIMIGIILIAGLLMFFASYCLFVAGISFVGRMIELFILIIFSPFAFMSSTVPKLAGVEYLGWDAWFKRLITVSFMAPIFMFFLYFIFMLISAKPSVFGNILDTSKKSLIETILLVVIPAMIILILLLKATDFAKKGGGKLGEVVMKGAKMAGGLALGAATGGAALLGAGAVGSLASRAASSKELNAKAKENTFGGMAARMALKTADYGSKATFDVRKIPGVGSLAKAGGINLEAAKGIGLGSKEGGYQQRRKEQVEKRQKRAKELEVREDEPLKQALNKTEMDLQGLLSKNTKDIEGLDKLIEKKRQEADDASRKYNAVKDTKGPRETTAQTAARTTAQTALQDANSNLDSIKQAKKDLREGRAYSHTDVGGTAPLVSGASVGTTTRNINSLEKQQKIDAQAIKTENVERRQAYAKRIVKYGGNGIRTDREAAHKIVMEVKLDSGTKT